MQEREGVGKRRSSLWFKVLAALLAAALLILAFRGVKWNELLATVARARCEYVLVCCLVACFTTFLRGLRWSVLLRAAGPISMGAVTWASIAGQVTNSFIPGRGGDVFRVMYLARHAEASKSFALATTLTERVMDAACLTLFGLMAMMWLESVPEWMVTGTRVMAVLAVTGVAFLFAIPLLQRPIHAVVGRLPLPQAVHLHLTDVIPRFVLGLKALHQPVRASAFFSLTVLIWLSDALGAVLWAIALHLTLSFQQAVLFNAVLGLSQAIPTTPAGIGVYQFLAVTVLVPFGFARSEALAYILSVQMLFYVVMATLGFIALLRPEGGFRMRRGLSSGQLKGKSPHL